MAEPTFQSLIEDLEKYLEYQRDEGVQRLEVERAVLEELASEPLTEAPEEKIVEAVPVPADFADIGQLAAYIGQCRSCPLCQTRNLTVPGEGRTDGPDIMFVGEGPGADEDEQGRPFVGKAGQLLDKMIEAMGYSRGDVYIANVVKCRPPQNRKPHPEEMQMCLPYLRQQIRMIRPKVLVGLGGTAMEGLLGRPVGITRIRGVWQEYEGIRLMPTFHPSYLLRDASKKKDAWLDLKAVLAELGKTPPPRK
ncbi:MAG: uracil-DNA glycosylase [Pontiellaceae bacterium]|nr:uracil-DNA glycosylase [Pontiellaceae bacterium]MBN2784683.1 uracil-DNA glycosylase [Pontiellaceae bacterium]